MKNIMYILVGVAIICGLGASLTSVSQIDGNALHTMQSAWVIVEEEFSADTEAPVLTVTQRTKKIVDALIVADASNEANISVFSIPAKWNAVRLRALGITNAATATHDIYFGTLGGGLDCELSYAGSLAWVIGTQQSIYEQITFTLGGAGTGYVPQIGDTVTGNTSGETAVIVSIVETASTWAAGTAAGTITYRSPSGTFTAAETVSILRARKVITNDALKHANSVFVEFEFADTLVTTAKAWGSSWTTTTPADNTNAEAEIDIKGADYMVIVTSATSVDSKLIIRGF